MALALDRELADFFNFLGHRMGLANCVDRVFCRSRISALPGRCQEAAPPAANLDFGQI